MSAATTHLNTFYRGFFLIHLAIIFTVDIVPLYPAIVTSQPIFAPLLQLRKWYIVTYNDRFFISPPAWFTAFAWMEAGYHVPLSLWALRALKTDNPLVPLHLLIYSIQTFLTTIVCIVDYSSWTAITAAELRGLNWLYMPYCVFCNWLTDIAAMMGVDMFLRLRNRLLKQGLYQGHKKE